MQLITFFKQLFYGMREDSRAESFAKKPSVITLKKHMLFEGNFNRDIKHLYALGRSSYQPSHLKEEDLSVVELWEKLGNLHCLLEAWEDSGLNRTNKKERHALKYKKDLAKPIRRMIHKALRMEVINLAEVVLIKALKDHAEDGRNIVELSEQLAAVEANEKISGSKLIELSSKCLQSLKIINPDLKSPENIEQRFKKAASAITSFKTFRQKILASLSVSVAIIAALACGFFTGGAIYALIGSALLPGLVIPIVVIVGVIGFAVNGRFFSKSLPEFLLKLFNPSRITEFINEEGERKQFSNLKKYVYLPLAALFSVAVGISFAAFSLVQLSTMLVALPFLAATGPLPIILAVVLAVVMTIVMFKAFVEIAPKLSASGLWQSLKTAWQEMSFIKFLSHGITLAVCGIGVFGLFMACHMGVPTLGTIFGGPASIFVFVTSFVGQLPFNVLTVSTFCKVMGNFFLSIPAKVKSLFRKEPVQLSEAAEKSPLLNKIASASRDIITGGAMLINGVANGATLLSGTPLTSKYIAAGAAGALNSISGNLVDDNDTQERSQADKAAIQALKGSLVSDNNTQERSRADTVVQGQPGVSKVDETPIDSGSVKAPSLSEEMLRPSSPLHFKGGHHPPVAQQTSVASCKERLPEEQPARIKIAA